jgi:hypothetical protein
MMTAKIARLAIDMTNTPSDRIGWGIDVHESARLCVEDWVISSRVRTGG